MNSLPKLVVRGNKKGGRRDMDFIEAFFDVLNDKVLFLRQLFDSQRQDEAMTLCCVYIDGLGRLHFPDDRSAFNFVRALREHGEQPYLDLVHPAGLVRWLKLGSQTAKSSEVSSQDRFGHGSVRRGNLSAKPNSSKRSYKDSATANFRSSLPSCGEERLHTSLTSGYETRSSTHCAATVEFVDEITYDGQPVPEIDFSMLHSALESLARHAYEISVKSGKFFGRG